MRLPKAIPLEQFEAIEVRGSVVVTLVPGPVQRVTTVDSNCVRIQVAAEGRLVVEKGWNHSRGGDLHVCLEAARIPEALSVYGGGAIHVDPGFPHLEELSAVVEGGGIIELRALNVEDVAAAVRDGGSILVRPLSSLTATISGGGEIRYSGDAQVSASIDRDGHLSREPEEALPLPRVPS